MRYSSDFSTSSTHPLSPSLLLMLLGNIVHIVFYLCNHCSSIVRDNFRPSDSHIYTPLFCPYNPPPFFLYHSLSFLLTKPYQTPPNPHTLMSQNGMPPNTGTDFSNTYQPSLRSFISLYFTRYLPSSSFPSFGIYRA